MQTTYEKTVIPAAKPASNEKTVIHTEKPASNELGNPATQEPEPAGGLLDSIKAGVMAGVETVREGVNYVADSLSGAAATDAPAVNAAPGTTYEKKIEKTEYNPEVEKRTKIVKEQTTYPNQEGYGVNPKFKEGNDSGAMADIKSGLKKGVENIKESAKEFKEDVKDGARELKNNVKEGWEDVKIEANRMTQPSPPRTYADMAAVHQDKAVDLLEERDKDLHKAQKAQAKANEKQWEANVKAAKAANKHELGQEYLAQAGAEMQCAGAQMKADARRF